MPAVETVTVADLLALFHGDEDSRPCYSAALVQAVCEQVVPGSEDELREVFHQGMPLMEVTFRASMAVERGWLRWKESQS